MSENITLILLAIILLLNVFGLIYFLFIKSNNSESSRREVAKDFDSLHKVINNLENRISDNIKTIDTKIVSSEREMKRVVEGVTTTQFDNSNKQFLETTRLVSEITRELTEVKEGNKQVFSMTEQLSNLEKVLTNQKQRGNWGESSLELILSNIINNHYQMQYRFESGEAVDAVIFIKDKMLPIDSKFSLENYQRCLDAEADEDKKYFAEEFKKDLKVRITETAKYIKEKENTLPIAFMFIPSEAIYYDLLAGENSRLKVNTQKLIEYAQSQKVFIVSPTSILAYLHLVLSGIKAFTIEESAKQIQKKVEELGKHIEKYDVYMKKLGNSINTSVNHYTDAYKELKKVDKDVYKITEGEAGNMLEVLQIDKVNIED
jgi:DNA recombination protein RmuC